MSEKKQKQDYGEPWTISTGKMGQTAAVDRHGMEVHWQLPRASACVNACAGLEDPAAFVETAKHAEIYNDTDMPLDELLSSLCDIVADVKPDAESDNAGTLTERAQACRDAVDENVRLRAEIAQLRELARNDFTGGVNRWRHSVDGHLPAVESGQEKEQRVLDSSKQMLIDAQRAMIAHLESREAELGACLRKILYSLTPDLCLIGTKEMQLLIEKALYGEKGKDRLKDRIEVKMFLDPIQPMDFTKEPGSGEREKGGGE